jgi:YVTN family beta-propeller protein
MNRAVAFAAYVLSLTCLSCAASYHQVAKFTLGGEGGWDYLTFDPDGNRVFIAHNNEILVVDANSGKKLGSVPADGAHGVALAAGKGFSTNGRAGTVTVFDAHSLKPIQDIKVGENPDAIIYDPDSKDVIVMNGRSHDVTVIDPASLQVTQTIPLGGKLEFAATEPGHVFVNVEDTAEIADIDSKTWKVAHKWKLNGCEEPTGLAIDTKKERLFTVCGNKVMLVVNAKDGSVLATVQTGGGTDGAGFDPDTGFAFASNGEGTLTVVREGKDGKYAVAENVTTARGARTMTVDPKTHKIFTATAELGPPAEGERRPSIKPDTFALWVYAP